MIYRSIYGQYIEVEKPFGALPEYFNPKQIFSSEDKYYFSATLNPLNSRLTVQDHMER